MSPVQHMVSPPGQTGRRYPAAVMLRAREHRAAGWTLAKIVELVERETGYRPAKTTVALWCYPEGRQERRRAAQNLHRQRERALTYSPMLRVSAEWRLARMRELHLRDVSARAIGQVAAVWWGEELSERQVRRRLGLEPSRRRVGEGAVR